MKSEEKFYGELVHSREDYDIYRKEDRINNENAEDIHTSVFLYTLVFRSAFSPEVQKMKFLRWVLEYVSPYEVSNKFKIRSTLYTKINKPIVYTIQPKDFNFDTDIMMLIFDCPQIFGKRSLYAAHTFIDESIEEESKQTGLGGEHDDNESDSL